jgi:hypothetical protein
MGMMVSMLSRASSEPKFKLKCKAEQAAEKVFLSVIPSEARDLLLAKSQEKSRFLAAFGASK